jgi:hypothetical protein
MRALYPILAIALIGAVAAPTEYAFQPRPTAPFVGERRPTATRDRVSQIRRIHAARYSAATGFVDEGPATLFTLDGVRYRAIFGGFPHGPMSVTPVHD